MIKIDIEGMELPALKGMTQTLKHHHPELYMEMHGATLEQKDANVRNIVEFVSQLGYGFIVHVESGERITTANATRARRGHLYARFRP